MDDYNNIKTDNWSMRDETLKYLENDLLTLLEVLISFSNDIFRMETVNITKSPTISSLAFRILLTNYLNASEIFQIKGPAHDNMRDAYFGGITEAYHRSCEGEGFAYDVNSSHPASMKQPLPVGSPIYSTDPVLDNYFGIAYAEIETPKDENGKHKEEIMYPPLPFRLPDKSIINPIGNWSGMYFSELLKYVRDYWGYTVKVVYGYKFKAEKILDNFIDTYYNIKSGRDTTTNINRLTAKLLLNCVYGRFGLKMDNGITAIVTPEESLKIQNKYHVKDINPISDKLHWISYNNELSPLFIQDQVAESNCPEEEIRLRHNESAYEVEQSLPIAIAITAYSTIRLFEAIRKLKEKNPDLIIYAVDTDSIHTNKQLPDEMVGDELGQWKLEFVIKEGIYALPKVYYARGYKVKDGIISDKITEIRKGKGVKRGSISREEYMKLLSGENIEKREKRFIIDGSRKVVRHDDVSITLSPTLNKRIPLGNYWTMPLLVINGEIVSDYTPYISDKPFIYPKRKK